MGNAQRRAGPVAEILEVAASVGVEFSLRSRPITSFRSRSRRTKSKHCSEQASGDFLSAARPEYFDEYYSRCVWQTGFREKHDREGIMSAIRVTALQP